MKHAFLILTHFPPEKIYRQVQRLQSAGHCFFIHFDKKLAVDPYDPFYKKLVEMGNTVILQDRINVQWGGFRTIAATLSLIREALKDRQVGYLHFLSGECLPVKSMEYFHEYFTTNAGKEFIDYFLMTSKAYHGITFRRLDKYHLHDYFNPRSSKAKDVAVKLVNSILRKSQRLLRAAGIYRRYPTGFPAVYAGRVHWSLTYAACEYIVNYSERHREFYNRFRYTQSADEMYFQTILVNSPFKGNITNFNLRFVNFVGLASSPRPLTIANLNDIKPGNILFARKFTPESAELLEYLEKNVY
jgi:core-2/I-Branching enzyme